MELERRVGIIGLENGWLVLGEADVLMIFEGVLRANFEVVGGADCCSEDSDTVIGVCDLETGN